MSAGLATQDDQEMRLPEGQRSTEWVKCMPAAVVAILHNDVTRTTGKKASVTIKAKNRTHNASVPFDRPVDLKEQKLPSGGGIRYLCSPGELEVELECSLLSCESTCAVEGDSDTLLE